MARPKKVNPIPEEETPGWEYPAMSPAEYERVRAYFGLPNQRFAKLIGVHWRQAARYKSGATPVPEPTAKLLRTAINNHLTAEDIG